MKIYVATAFGDKAIASGYMRRLEACGHTITHDWTTSEDALKGINGDTMSHEMQWRHAAADLHGITTADVLWLLLPATGGAGCFVELGYALDSVVGIYVSGPTRTIFESHPHIWRFDTHEAAFEAITNA